MPAKPQEKPQKVPSPPKHPPVDIRIADQVVAYLGQPSNVHTVQVRCLWENHYRVNVFVGADAATALVAHSYFLVTDGEGAILQSTPKMAKHA